MLARLILLLCALFGVANAQFSGLTLPLSSGINVLQIGDSIIDNIAARPATWATDIGGTVTSSGSSGAKCDAVRTTWDSLVPSGSFGLIYLHCGLNDVANSRPLDDIKADLAYMIADAQSRNIPVIVDTLPNGFFSGPSDVRYLNILTMNTWLGATYGAVSTVLVSDFWTFFRDPATPWTNNPSLTSDGLHLTTAATDAWIGVLRDRINSSATVGSIVSGNVTISGKAGF